MVQWYGRGTRGNPQGLTQRIPQEFDHFNLGPQQWEHIGESSNGRTTDFGSVYLGSNPSPATIEKGDICRLFLWLVRNRFRLES